MSEIIALRCDGEGCDVVQMPGEAKVKSYRTPQAQQQHRGKRKHYCAEHYPYDQCVSCHKKLRPYQSKAADWPGTVARAKSNPPLCTNCYAKGWAEVDTKPRVEAQTASKVRSLVIRHYRQFEADAWMEPADEVLEMLGLDT